MNKSDLSKLSAISKIIKQSKTFFIAGHVKPDGDSIGSSFALGSMLKRLGKKVTVYSFDDIPENIQLTQKHPFKVKKSAKSSEKFDCAIILESLNFSRMGDIIKPSQAKKIINIDHHLLHTNFGDVNYVVPNSSSTAELIFSLFEYMKIKPNKYEAQNLYLGIVTDTGRFQQINTTPNTHIVASKLLALDISPDFITKKVYSNNTLHSLKLLGDGLSNIKICCNGKMAYIVVTKKMIKKAGLKKAETAGMVNFTLTLKGVQVGGLFKEGKNNMTEMSFRSVQGVNILDVVKEFGGGGHKNAAGCKLNKSVSESVKIIKKAFEKKLKNAK